jgi:hypothetical protein
VSSVPATSDGETWPQRCQSLPRSPLTTEQLETVEEAFEQKYSNVTVWVGSQPETLTRDLGIVTISSSKQTVVEFVVETDERYQVFNYTPQPGGGYWERCMPTAKDEPEAELWEQSLADEEMGYTRLTDALQGGGS